MPDHQLRFGIVGAGEIALQTAHAIDASQHTCVTAVMDVREEMARDLASACDAAWTTDASDLLTRSDVDAVYIAVPHYLHAPLSVNAAHAGKHVLCEKPMATTLDDADRMIAACRDAGVTLSIGFDAQVTPIIVRVRELVRAGAIGQVIGVHVAQLIDKPASYWSSGWSGRVTTDWRVSKEKAGGGVLVMNGIHDLNTVRFVTGLEVRRVYAEYGTFATPVEVEDYLVATLRYDNGAAGTIEMGSCIRGGSEIRGPGIRIYGTAGQITLGDSPRIYVTRSYEEYEAGTWQDIGGAYEQYSRLAIVDGFANAVLEGNPPPVTGEDGRATLEIVLAAYRSGETGRPVDLGSVASER
jgi:predicted dehydrogenase